MSEEETVGAASEGEGAGGEAVGEEEATGKDEGAGGEGVGVE